MTDIPKRECESLPTLPDAALRLLGFCRRSGKIVCGAGQVLAAITGKRPPVMVIIAADASQRTKKQLRDKCSHRNIPSAISATGGEELARLLGKEGVVMAVGATDSDIGGEMIRLTFPQTETSE